MESFILYLLQLTRKKVLLTLYKKDEGFTLVEVLVTIFIFVLIIGAVSSLIVVLYRTHGYVWEESQAIDEARRGIGIMIKEIRQAQAGDDGSFPIGKAGDKEFIFYSDIDNDGQAEKIRYFLGTVNSGTIVQECQSAGSGSPPRDGSCSVTFSNFLTGNLKSAQIKISAKGDLDASTEYISISADGTVLTPSGSELCRTNCGHCSEAWEGDRNFDVATQAGDGFIQFTASANNNVGRECPTAGPTYSMKAKFELSWTEEIIGAGNELKKGVIEPTGSPLEYPPEQEKISIITSYVRNAPPIFEYFNAQGNKIEDYPARLVDTKIMKLFLVVNVDPNRPPNEFELESFVQLRNLKQE